MGSFRGWIVAGGLVFTLPAIAINVQMALSHGKGVAELLAAIFFVMAACVAGFSMEKAFRGKAYGLAAAGAALLGVFILINLSNALGNFATERSGLRDTLGGQRKIVEGLEGRRRELDPLIAQGSRSVDGKGSKVLQAEIDAKKLQPFFGRSDGCQNVTVQESRAACAELFALDGKLSTALSVEKWMAERSKIDGELVDAGTAPESVDPQSEGIHIALAVVGLDIGTPKDVGLGVDVLKALGIELMAGVLPGLISFVAHLVPVQRVPTPVEVPSDQKVPPAKARAPRKTRKALEPASKVPASIQAFANAKLRRRQGGEVSAADLFASFREFCAETGAKAETQAILGVAMIELGFTRVKKGSVRYVGVVLQGLRPELLVVGA